MDHLLRQIEDACADFQVPSTRAHAEKILQEFRLLPNVIPACQYILEHSGTPFVQFQAATTIKEAIVREWAIHPKETIAALRNYLLGFVSARADVIKPFVREQLLLVIAVIIKGGWLDPNSPRMTEVIDQCLQLLGMRAGQKTVALSLLLAITREFSSTKASAVGFTWEFHFKCRRSFEDSELPRIFSIVIDVLKGLVNLGGTGYTEEVVNVFITALALSEQIFHWEFTYYDLGKLSGHFKKNDTGESAEYIAFQPPKSWQPVVLNDQFLPMFFHLHMFVSSQSRLSNHTRQCLVQLTTLTGQIFPSDDAKAAYISALLQGTLSQMSKMSSSSDLGAEIHAICQMIKNIISNFGVTTLILIPEFPQFIQQTFELSLYCLRLKPSEIDDTWNMEAFDLLLMMWASLLGRASYQLGESHQAFLGTLRGIASSIFGTYVETRLSGKVDDFDGENEEEDQTVFEDQLIAIAVLGRFSPGPTLSMLHRLVLELTQTFQQLLDYSTRNKVSGGESTTLFERLHWLVLLCGNILADSGHGEKPLVPDNLLLLSSSSPVGDDPVVTLSNALANLFGVISLHPTDPRISLCSPLLVETVIWYFERWSQTYLFPNPRDYSNLSNNILAAYGAGSESAQNLLAFLLEKMDLSLLAWKDQEDVLKEIARLLKTLSTHKMIRAAIVKQERWPIFMKNVVDFLHVLPSEVQCPLVETICRMASGAEQQVQSFFISLITGVAENRIRSLLERQDFMKVSQKSESILQLIVCLEMFRGVAMAADGSNFEVVFKFCSGYFNSFVKLLDVYHNCPEVILVILKFYNCMIESQLSLMGPAHADLTYQSVLSLFQVYSQRNLGRKSAKKVGEEDLQDDVLMMLKIMTNLISKDFLDFSDDSGLSAEVFVHSDPSGTQVSDVVFYGLNIVIPLITADLLSFPELCLQYFKLISFMLEIYSEKLVGLPQPLFQSLMKSFEFGIERSHNAEVSKLTMEALSGLGAFCYNANAKGDVGPSVQLLGATLDSFLALVMRLILYQDFDANLMEPASEALFAIICARFNSFNAIAQQIVGQIPQESIRARLSEAFSQLLSTNNLEAKLDRKNNGRFKENLEKFLMNVRGFLRVR